MPCPYQKRRVLLNESLNSPKLRACKATAPLQSHRIEPELSLGFLPLHVDVRRFVSIRRVEEQPVRSGSKNCRQRSSSVHGRRPRSTPGNRRNGLGIARLSLGTLPSVDQFHFP